ncbi:hypothetical protein GTP46_28510 [Duganella sp. FT135W]|uniref:Uncharacterized protein n=1 Tax=Duganella flavida TaxID=2692175 RepID=A0A6L8KGH9_9BURK|nr:hypothetical protein [Duganella flavida]MYM26573.1 hypothetical protein [Duganella flavida]
MENDTLTAHQHARLPFQRLVYCKRDAQEWLKCENLVLFHSSDAGNSWQQLPMERTLWSRLVLAASDWPPTPRAFGWRNGKIVILHDDFHEDGSPNFRFVSTFNPQSKKWAAKSYGPVSDYSEQWWSELAFDALATMGKENTSSDSPAGA